MISFKQTILDEILFRLECKIPLIQENVGKRWMISFHSHRISVNKSNNAVLLITLIKAIVIKGGNCFPVNPRETFLELNNYIIKVDCQGDYLLSVLLSYWKTFELNL